LADDRSTTGISSGMKLHFFRYGTGIVLLSTAVFLITILSNLNHGFWHDEVISLKFASPGLSLVESFEWWASFEPHPYTYYFFLRIWLLIVGFGATAAKIFNPLLFLVAAILSYRLWPAERRREFIYFMSLNMTSVWSLYFLIEVRPYGAMLAVSLLAASCVFAIQHITETEPGTPRNLYRHFNYLTGCVIILATLDSWGVLLGGGIVIFMLLRYRALRTRIIDKWLIFALLAALSGILGLQYLNIFLLYGGFKSLGTSLGGFSLDASSGQFFLIMIGELWEHIFVTLRSQVVGIVAAVVWAMALIVNRRAFTSDIWIYLGPVAFAYGVVLVLYAIHGQAFYRHYSSLPLLPFIFTFLLATAFRKTARPYIAVAAMSLFILANILSIPFLDKFQDKPRNIDYVEQFEGK
jgi:hypothetical protein